MDPYSCRRSGAGYLALENTWGYRESEMLQRVWGVAICTRKLEVWLGKAGRDLGNFRSIGREQGWDFWDGLPATGTHGHMVYLDCLLAALDLLNLGLGQGDPLPNGLQLPPAELYSLRDSAMGGEKKTQRLRAAPQAPAVSCTPASICRLQSQGLPQGPLKYSVTCLSRLTFNCPGDLHIDLYSEGSR